MISMAALLHGTSALRKTLSAAWPDKGMKMPAAAGCLMPRWGRRLIRSLASPDQRASFELGREPAATARRQASIDFSHLKIAVLSHLSVD
ncbi:MAG: hypothetical protein E5X84_17055 [Mesorhizobium sp.]|nr:MAG: hypothetical protein E5X84_17055 [Mesorhizobium sp.]